MAEPGPFALETGARETDALWTYVRWTYAREFASAEMTRATPQIRGAPTLEARRSGRFSTSILAQSPEARRARIL